MSFRFTSFASSSALVLTSLVLTSLLVAGCWMREPNYCPGKNPHNNCLEPGDGPLRCTSNADCTPPLVCDVSDTQTCVQCTAFDDRACTGVTPVCGVEHACRACRAHAECGSRACLPDGSCGDNTRVAYVDPTGTDNSLCTSEAPCTRVFRALATGRPYVKLVGITDEPVTVAGGQAVTFLAEPGTKLTRASSAGPILTVRDNGTSLSIYDLSISDALGVSGVGLSILPGGSPSVTLVRTKLVNNAGGAIVAAGGGTLTVAQSVISRNTGGGITVSSGTFTIIGNVFFDNGTQSTPGGAVHISAQPGGHRLEFNSFHWNAAAVGIGPAIHCVTGLIAARNNIMSENRPSSGNDQIGGHCTHEFSIVRPGVLPPGRGNSSVDPLFVNQLIGDLHVRAGSPARRAADPSSNLTGLAGRDIDGDVRAHPTADIGADEVP